MTMWRPSPRVACGFVIAQLAGSLLAAPPQESQPSSADSAAQRALLNKYCVTCHNERLHTAGLTLEKADVSNIATDPALWEKVLEKVRTGAMPPAGLPRPDASSYASLSSY